MTKRELSYFLLNFIQILIDMFNYCIFSNQQSHYPHNHQVSSTNVTINTPPSQMKTQEDLKKLRGKYERLKTQYKKSKDQNKKLKSQVSQLQQIVKPEMKGKKVKRRMESQLSKECKCPYLNCKKDYASNIALNLHIRIKHNGGTKKERISYAKAKIEAAEKGLELPPTQLNLPPEVIQYELSSLHKKDTPQPSSQKISQASEIKIERFSSELLSIENEEQE